MGMALFVGGTQWNLGKTDADMKNNRDDFPTWVRREIQGKSGYRCSNPACRKMLVGPSEDFKKAVYLGTVAHICAAAPGGPRYDPSMTPEERAGEENGLLLCRHCAALVDIEERTYPTEVLRQWKRQAYKLALGLLAEPANGMEDSRCWLTVKEMVRVCLCLYQTQGCVSKEARFRSYAGILYRLFFEDLPRETDYDRQIVLWREAVEKIVFDGLEDTACRVARYDGSFPRRYRCLMAELQTYAFQPREQRARLLNVIEGAIQELFHSGEAFGLRENQSKEVF